MNIILLGSTGYLGTHLIPRFTAQGHCLLCVGRDATRLLALQQQFPGIQTCSFEQLDTVLSQQEPFDCMVNTLCQYPRGAESEAAIFAANLVVPLQSFLTCTAHGVHRVITIDTGLPDSFNAYSISKAKFAELLHWYADRLSTQGKALQICNVQLENFYGPDEPTDRFLPGAVQKLKQDLPIPLTAGAQKRDFIHIDDVLDTLTALLTAPLPCYLDLPLGTGEAVPVRQVIEYLKELLGSHSELRFGAVPLRQNEPDSVADLTALHRLGLSIRYSWKDGLKCFL